ncbi:hypothetical protein GCM10023213_01640 [Prosthecobacter algae]|uniref:Uncharacterized protein n=1 Tax=Prosthecobacter algae TaxID=1144682 RepID=A0ABP9NRY4_9BACT
MRAVSTALRFTCTEPPTDCKAGKLAKDKYKAPGPVCKAATSITIPRAQANPVTVRAVPMSQP